MNGDGRVLRLGNPCEEVLELVYLIIILDDYLVCLHQKHSPILPMDSYLYNKPPKLIPDLCKQALDWDGCLLPGVDVKWEEVRYFGNVDEMFAGFGA